MDQWVAGLTWAALICLSPLAAHGAPILPDDGGWQDVQCDGLTDSTAAIEAAMTANPSPLGAHPVRLPEQTCMISAQLVARLMNGTWLANTQLYGRGMGISRLRLWDASAGFGNAALPKAMVYTASQVTGNSGAEAPTTGSWNEAFQNRIWDLTIECGVGNAGCIPIDFAGNNAGASIRHVELIGPGPVGLSMTRKYPGPLVVEDVHIHGFAVGVDVAQLEYGVTLNELEIDGYTVAKVRNGANSVSIRRLTGCGPQPSVLNTDPKGFVSLLESPGEQISGPGSYFIRDSGREIASPAVLQVTPEDLPTSLGLAIQEPPPRFESNDPNDWANCTAYGVIPGATSDQGSAMIAALNSGKPIVYCPDNGYRFGRQMPIPATVKVLDMLGSGAKPASGTNPSRFLRVEASSTEPLYIRRFSASSYTHQMLYVSAQRPVVLEDVSFGRQSQIVVEPGAGPVFLNGVMTSQLDVRAGASVFATMLNLEGLAATGAPQYLVAGRLWAQSVKYETPIARGRTLPGGCTEILGGLDYPVGAVPAGTVEHEVIDGQAFFAYAESAYQSANEFPIALRLTRGGVVTDVLGSALPARGAGRFAVLSAHTGACAQ